MFTIVAIENNAKQIVTSHYETVVYFALHFTSCCVTTGSTLDYYRFDRGTRKWDECSSDADAIRGALFVVYAKVIVVEVVFA